MRVLAVLELTEALTLLEWRLVHSPCCNFQISALLSMVRSMQTKLALSRKRHITPHLEPVLVPMPAAASTPTETSCLGSTAPVHAYWLPAGGAPRTYW